MIGIGGGATVASGVCYVLVWDNARKYNAENRSAARADQYKQRVRGFETATAATAGLAVVSYGIGAVLLTVSPRAKTAGLPAEHSLAVLPGPGWGATLSWKFR